MDRLIAMYPPQALEKLIDQRVELMVLILGPLCKALMII